MNARAASWKSLSLFPWILVLVLAGIVYSVGISHESFWYDEAYSAAITAHSISNIIPLVLLDNHPPLYYLLLRMVRVVLGDSEPALRALSVVGAIGMVFLAVGPLRRLFGGRTALIITATVLCTPLILIYAHEARSYTLAIFMLTAGALYSYLAVQENRARYWVVFGAASLIAAYLHYYALIAAFYTHVFIILWSLIKKRSALKASLITGSAVLLAYLPWLGGFVRQTVDVKNGFWLAPVQIDGILGAFVYPFAYRDMYNGVQPHMILAFCFSLALTVWGGYSTVARKREKERTLIFLLLFVFYATMATAVIVSLVLTPIFYARYMSVCAGLTIVLTGLGISQLPRKSFQYAAIGIFALLNSVTIYNVYTQNFNHPMRMVAQDLGSAIQPGDLIITSDSYSMGPALYYFPQAAHYYSTNQTEGRWGHVLSPLSPPLHIDEGLKDLLSTRSSFWYISCNTGVSKNVRTILKGETGWEAAGVPTNYSVSFSPIKFKAQKFARTGQEPEQRGTLNVHITGLKPVGQILAVLYDQDPVTYYRGLNTTPSPARYEAVPVMGEELVYAFDGLDYGTYVVMVAHDENFNYAHDFDRQGRLPVEGVWVSNGGRLDFSKGLEDFTFANLKFAFHEAQKTIEAKMMYPPYEGGE